AATPTTNALMSMTGAAASATPSHNDRRMGPLGVSPGQACCALDASASFVRVFAPLLKTVGRIDGFSAQERS
ncbi:MAG TPA: hypothetical protein VGS60_01955, partial [Actinomycetes bacterium]|nr:hypothetical protein [Actinomycetes bacterium]